MSVTIAGREEAAGAGTYACPNCIRELKAAEGTLVCRACMSTYPIVDGIPDFIGEDLGRSPNPVLRGVGGIDLLARVYETKLWYPVVLSVFGGIGTPSMEDIARWIRDRVRVERGRILDVACGPGTMSRGLASATVEVYGIDVSMGMLRQGRRSSDESGIPNVRFARARVEALPFLDRGFDAAICSGALHLFSDTTAALREIGRTMKPGAPLAVMTFVAGDRGVLRFPRIRTHVETDHGLHVFELGELAQDLSAAGFADFEPEVHGSLLLFRAQTSRGEESA